MSIEKTLKELGAPQSIDMAERCIELFGIFKHDKETDVENADHARRRLVFEFLTHGPEWLQIVSAFPALKEEIANLKADLDTYTRSKWASMQIANTEANEAAKLREAPNWFLEDECFDVAVGGNPLVEKMLADARRTLKGGTDDG